jgi:SagB-type dehydrogenase family enzyme
MKNSEIDAAWNYHNGTKHSYDSIRADRHSLDWENQPLPFKIYSGLEPLPLPQHLSSSAVPAFAAIRASGAADGAPMNIQVLTEILFLSAGITKRRRYSGGEILFRAAACTGALYHIDLYLVCGELDQLTAGVYHFSPHDFALRRLRAGDYRSALAHAAAAEPAIANAACIIASASTFWRNAWKYRSRAYRHCYWDNGTILANLMAAAAARDITAKIVAGFIDAAVEGVLGLDPQREAPLSLVALGGAQAAESAASDAMETLALPTEPLSKTEVDYPEMRAMHEASALETAEEVREWRQAAAEEQQEESGAHPAENRVYPLRPDTAQIAKDSIEEVIMRRGSTREFARQPIAFAELSRLLESASGPIPADFLTPDGTLNDIYLIVHAVEGLPSGSYRLRRQEGVLELLKEGDFRREAGYLGLGQDIPADSSANIYFLADLHRALDLFGNRGYRAAQLEAAIRGGKIYLAAYAQRLGASGLTFFDDDVTDFFSPSAAGRSVMFLIAVGKSAKRTG